MTSMSSSRSLRMWADGAWTTCHGKATKGSLPLLGWGRPASGVKKFKHHDSISWTFVYLWFPNISWGRLPKNYHGRWFLKTKPKPDFRASPTEIPVQEVWDGGPWNLFSGFQWFWPIARSRDHGFLVHNFPRSWKVSWMPFRSKLLDAS